MLQNSDLLTESQALRAELHQLKAQMEDAASDLQQLKQEAPGDAPGGVPKVSSGVF